MQDHLNRPAILFLIDIMRWRGGTEIHLCELATRLSAHGYHPIVCNLGGEEPVLSHLAREGVETWPRAVRRIYAPEGRAATRRVIREAAGRNVRAVHTFHFKSDWMGTRVARALRCPLISSRRDLGFQRSALHNFVYRFINPRVSAFLVPSRSVGEHVARTGGIAPERIHTIYNGLDRSRFTAGADRADARAWLGLPESGPVIGMVSGFRPIKDHPTLLRAFRGVADARPDASLALIGEGTEEATLRALTSELGLSERVAFTGPRKDVPRALAALDIFALATHSEGMSNAILEAMAAGLPVVATDVGGNPECVVDGETGFIVPDSDEAALAARLLELLERPERAAAMGEAGRTRTAALFDVDAMVRKTVELYDSLGCRGAKEAADARA